jgi:hypothetical protein
MELNDAGLAGRPARRWRGTTGVLTWLGSTPSPGQERGGRWGQLSCNARRRPPTTPPPPPPPVHQRDGVSARDFDRSPTSPAHPVSFLPWCLPSLPLDAHAPPPAFRGTPHARRGRTLPLTRGPPPVPWPHGSVKPTVRRLVRPRWGLASACASVSVSVSVRPSPPPALRL